MIDLTEREEKLLEIVKKLINATTILSIYQSRSTELAKWAYNSVESAGITLEWQNDMLKDLEENFEIKYTKLNPQTLDEIKEIVDGDETA